MRRWRAGPNMPDATYEFHERIAILMEACGYTEAEAIQAAQRQALEAESRRMIKDR
jgi:hypothetical protein